jgi:hypothetical protein
MLIVKERVWKEVDEGAMLVQRRTVCIVVTVADKGQHVTFGWVLRENERR